MKHARHDYDPIQDPTGKIPEDEPVFLLRGQDKFAPEIIRAWIKLFVANGGDTHQANKLEEHVQKMEQWQKGELPTTLKGSGF